MSQNKKQNRLNGVDTAGLEEAKQVFTDEPKAAKIRYRVRNSWNDGAHNTSTIREFFVGEELDETREETIVVHNDAARAQLGADRGANPLEHVISALVGCLTTTMVYHAASQGVRIDEIESIVEAEQDARGFLGTSNKVRNGLDNIRIEFKVKGDAPDAKLRELVLLAQRFSPVYDTITNPVNVTVEGSVESSREAA